MTTSEGFIAPKFDDDAGRKLAIICSKGTLDMAYPGADHGQRGGAEGIEMHLFFTFWGLDIIRKKTHGQAAASPRWATPPCAPGAASLAMPQLLGGLPGMSGGEAWMMRGKITGLDVPAVPDFLTQITDAGGHLWACRMSVDMMKLTQDDFVDEVEDIISASDFMELTDGAQLLFI